MRPSESRVWTRVLAIALALSAHWLVAGVARASDDAPKPRDEWFTLSLGGSRCGWMNERVTLDGPRVETTSETRITVGRAGAEVSMAIAWRFVESPTGMPVECEVRTESGSDQSRAIYRFLPEGISVAESAGGRTITRTLARPPSPWLTPAQVESATHAARVQGLAEIAYMTIDPGSAISVIAITSKRTEQCSDGSSRWMTTNATLGLVSEDLIDASGALLTSKTRLPIGDLVATRTDKAVATAPWKAATFDLIEKTLVALSAPQDALLSARRATLRVWRADHAAVELPSAGAQSVAVQPDGSAQVEIDVRRTSTADEAERGDRALLASTAMIDASDPAIVACAARALAAAHLAPDSPQTARAEALRKFAYRFITKKDLATAFASASAVAASHSGDCSEHAVLLAALLRSQGIPARVASGLVYADEFAHKRGVFAWHMWTQALIDGQWRDLDATLGDRPFHPGHLLIATSVQDDAAIDADFSRLLTTIGTLRLEVVSVD